MTGARSPVNSSAVIFLLVSPCTLPPSYENGHKVAFFENESAYVGTYYMRITRTSSLMLRLLPVIHILIGVVIFVIVVIVRAFQRWMRHYCAAPAANVGARVHQIVRTSAHGIPPNQKIIIAASAHVRER